MAAETPSKAQQSDMGRESSIGLTSTAATRTGVTGAFVTGILISGCVFFICTEPDGFGGSGSTEMRAVSFFGPGDGGSTNGCVAAIAFAGADGFGAVKTVGGAGGGLGIDGAGVGGVGIEDGAAGATAAPDVGGKNVGFAGIIGGVGAGPAGTSGTVAGRDVGAAGRLPNPFAGGRDGKLMRAASREPEAASADAGGTRGGKVMRTVSFFGSIGSAIERRGLNGKPAEKREICHSFSPKTCGARAARDYAKRS